MIGITHLLFAFALAYILDFPVVYSMIGGVLTDIDVLFEYSFPLSHRGVVHTPLAGFLLIGLMFLATNRKDASLSLGLGHFSHLFLDTFTFTGIMWLFPLTTYYSLELIGYSDVVVNLSVMVLSITAALAWRYRDEVMEWRT